MKKVPNIFDKKKIRLNHYRSYLSEDNRVKKFFSLVSANLVSKISDLSLSFDKGLEIGTRNFFLRNLLIKENIVKSLYHTSSNNKLLKKITYSIETNIDLIPFKDNSFNLCISLLSLHTVDDLPGLLIQIKKCLKTGGVFLAAIPGGSSLNLLKKIFIEQELIKYEKIHPRFIPMSDLKDIGSLISKVGFKNTVVDKDLFIIKNKNTLELMKDIRESGESNSLLNRSKNFISKELIYNIDREYKYKVKKNHSMIETELEIFYLMAFK